MKNKVQFQSGEDDSNSSIEGKGAIHHVLSLPRRFIALVGLLLAFGLMPYMALADDAFTLTAQINSFIHGGVGTLSASYVGDEVTVTGTVTGATATLTLIIDANVTVKWGADYSGSTAAGIALVNILGITGEFEVITSGKIEQTGAGDAIMSSGTIIVSGGTVSAISGGAIQGTNGTIVVVSSGTVITITGYAINAGIITVSGTGEVKATDDGITGGFAIFGASNVEVKDNALVSSTIVFATIRTTYVNSIVTVSGGTVNSTGGGAINATDAGSTVIVSGGTVSVITGIAISASGDVTVSGTGEVKATDDGSSGGSCIVVSQGNVEVKDDALVSATIGTPIYANGINSIVTISGGTVSATTGTSISVTSTSSKIIISGGTVSSTTGYAISTNGDVTVSGTGEVKATDDGITGGTAINVNGNVEVKDNAVVSTTMGSAISANGAISTVTVSSEVVCSSGFAAIYVSNATNTGDNVFISGNGKVQSLGSINTIVTYGNVINTGGEVSATSGMAINAAGATSIVTVSGGIVTNNSSTYPTILFSDASNTGNNIFLSGTGKVQALGSMDAINTPGNVIMTGGEVSATSGAAINANGMNSNVNITDGVVSATTGYAIDAGGASGTVDVSGGFVFAYGIGIADVINNSGFSAPTGTGVVVAWDEAQGNTDYISGSETDLTILPLNGAWWALNGTSSGIGYGSNGFFEIAGVNVYFVYQVNFSVTGANGTLTASVDNAGIVSGAVVLAGKNVVFTATPASNYRVKEWTLNGVPVSGNTTNSFTLSNIAAAATVTVEFEEIPVITTTYNLNIGTFSGGSVTSTKYVYQENESVTLTITPDAGYVLNSISAYRTGAVSVSVSLSGTGNSRSFAMPAYDVTVTATFRNTSYQSMWEEALAIIENADFSILQQEANTLAELRIRLAEIINELIKGTGFVITPNEIVIFDFNFLPATAGNSGSPTGTNGYFEFRVTPPNTNKSAYNNGTITATAYDPTGNDLIVAREDSQTLRVWAQNGSLHVSGLTPGVTWKIFNLSGVLVYQSVATNEKADVQLSVRGVYVVTNGKKTVKAVISGF